MQLHFLSWLCDTGQSDQDTIVLSDSLEPAQSALLSLKKISRFGIPCGEVPLDPPEGLGIGTAQFPAALH